MEQSFRSIAFTLFKSKCAYVNADVMIEIAKDRVSCRILQLTIDGRALVDWIHVGNERMVRSGVAATLILAQKGALSKVSKFSYKSLQIVQKG